MPLPSMGTTQGTNLDHESKTLQRQIRIYAQGLLSQTQFWVSCEVCSVPQGCTRRIARCCLYFILSQRQVVALQTNVPEAHCTAALFVLQLLALTIPESRFRKRKSKTVCLTSRDHLLIQDSSRLSIVISGILVGKRPYPGTGFLVVWILTTWNGPTKRGSSHEITRASLLSHLRS